MNKTKCALSFVIAGILTIGHASADKPPWAGGGKTENGEHRERPDKERDRQRDGDARSPRDRAAPTIRTNEYFGDRHRTIAHEYYGEQFRRGHCPPGLAKKHNGCMPPGQAKKWTVGRPLAREVIYYDLPPALVAQFDRLPSGYRYVRVASDILLVALATGIVIDAIQDPGRM